MSSVLALERRGDSNIAFVSSVPLPLSFFITISVLASPSISVNSSAKTCHPPPRNQNWIQQAWRRRGIFYLDRQVFHSKRVELGKLDPKDQELIGRLKQYLQRCCRKDTFRATHWEIPNHVDWLGEVLLDCRRLIPSYAVSIYLHEEEGNQIPNGAIFEDQWSVAFMKRLSCWHFENHSCE